MSEREDDFTTVRSAMHGTGNTWDFEDAALARIQAHVEALEGALRQASDCCARPAGVCFDRAALVGGGPTE